MKTTSVNRKWWVRLGLFVALWTALALLEGVFTYQAQLRYDKPVSWALALRRSFKEWCAYGLLAIGIVWLSNRVRFGPGRIRRWRNESMKLLRYGAPGREKPGLLDNDGNIRDLSKIVAQIDDALLAPRNLARLARVKPETLPIVRGNPRLGVPYAGISKFVAIGLNYRDHAEESGLPIPPEPVVFMKASTCLCGPNARITLCMHRPNPGSRRSPRSHNG